MRLNAKPSFKVIWAGSQVIYELVKIVKLQQRTVSIVQSLELTSYLRCTTPPLSPIICEIY